ncbi:MAG: hypothetical protein JWN92_560 [Candidatus Acidoferrum typicum]|nr:hypothetical protein [Candidatus Acidoferrum typicum]
MDFLVDGFRVIVSNVNEDGHPVAVKVEWTEDEFSCGWCKHITDDGGNSYRKFEEFMIPTPPTTNLVKESQVEADPITLKRLQRIWVAYQQKCSEQSSITK